MRLWGQAAKRVIKYVRGNKQSKEKQRNTSWMHERVEREGGARDEERLVEEKKERVLKKKRYVGQRGRKKETDWRHLLNI